MIHKKIFWICLIVSVFLVVAGFLVPPLGVIDGSVLTGVGLLLAFAALAQIPYCLEAANHITLQKGDLSLDVHKDEDDDDIAG